MKLTKISAAIAATTMAASVHAQNLNDTGLAAGLSTSGGGTPGGVSAVAIIVSDRTAAGLRSQQGIDAICNSSPSTVLCAPSISSAELRALMTNTTVSSTATLDGAALNLKTAGGFSGKNNDWREYTSAGVSDALNAFLGSGVIDSLACGQGPVVNITDSANAGDLEVISDVEANSANNPQIGLIHATALANTGLSFVKLDGVPPSALDLASSNYNLVSNLHGTIPAVADATTHGITVGIVTSGVGAGVASHIPAACSPLSTGSSIAEIDGGAE